MKISVVCKVLDSDFQRYKKQSLSGRRYIKFLQVIIMLVTNPGLFAIVNHRYGCWILYYFSSNDKRYYRYFFNIFYYLGKKISVVWGKIDILDGLPIGAGLFISNKGGVFLGASSIGKNCTIGSSVTVGLDPNGNRVTIENDVVVGSNSLVYGGCTIGNRCVIGADTVLTKSTPENVYMKGNPAILQKKNIYNKINY